MHMLFSTPFRDIRFQLRTGYMHTIKHRALESRFDWHQNQSRPDQNEKTMENLQTLECV
jgi:hypothetical protein